MQKKCNSCGRVLNIPDGKIPPGKAVFVTCPSCRDKIRIIGEEKIKEPTKKDDFPHENNFSPESADFPVMEDDGDPFDFIEEEGESAMVCIEDKKIREQVCRVLEYLEYSISSPEEGHEALRNLRIKGDFSLIVVDEDFSCESIKNNPVVRYVKRLVMRDRRDIFVALVSSSRRTFDRKDAFIHSVDMIINKNHVSKFEDFIKKGLAQSEGFYKNFREALKKGLNF